MVIHPPMLYLGYVGMTVPFGVAVAALLRGELGDAWMAPLRRWTLIAVDVPLGRHHPRLAGGRTRCSAGAATGRGTRWRTPRFLPWLTATAFIHSTMVQERKRMLKLWTLSLALATLPAHASWARS